MVKEVHGRIPARRGPVTNPYQQGRPNQKPSGLACGTPYQTLPDPVLAERNPLVLLVWCGVALPGPTNHVIWLHLRSRTLLPCLTGRGVKYTHNDRNNDIPHPDSGPARIRPIPQEHIQEVIPVTDGGAQHRYVDPPTTWHSVADPHAVATIPQGGPPGLDPTTTSNGCNCPDTVCEANNFGKEFLRMEGIVQMLHARKQSNDN